MVFAELHRISSLNFRVSASTLLQQSATIEVAAPLLCEISLVNSHPSKDSSARIPVPKDLPRLERLAISDFRLAHIRFKHSWHDDDDDDKYSFLGMLEGALSKRKSRGVQLEKLTITHAIKLVESDLRKLRSSVKELEWQGNADYQGGRQR